MYRLSPSGLGDLPVPRFSLRGPVYAGPGDKDSRRRQAAAATRLKWSSAQGHPHPQYQQKILEEEQAEAESALDVALEENDFRYRIIAVTPSRQTSPCRCNRLGMCLCSRNYR